jgi:hypothetical protein
LAWRTSQMRTQESWDPTPRMRPSGWNCAAVWPVSAWSSSTCTNPRHNNLLPSILTFSLFQGFLLATSLTQEEWQVVTAHICLAIVTMFKPHNSYCPVTFAIFGATILMLDNRKFLHLFVCPKPKREAPLISGLQHCPPALQLPRHRGYMSYARAQI